MNDSTVTNTSSSSIGFVIQFCVLLLICFLACLNILLIIIRQTFRENKMNWLSINVSLATAVFTMAQLILAILQQQKAIVIRCNLQIMITDMTVSQIMYAYCVFSIHRLAIIRYYNKFFFRSTCSLFTSIVIGWIAGFIIIIPYAFGNTSVCNPEELSIWLKIYTALTIFFLPVVIVSGCNTSIFLYIHQISRRVEASNSNRNNNILARRRDVYVSKMMLSTFLLFVIGWMPIFFENLFTSSNNPLPTNVSLFFQSLFSISLLGNIIFLIYANQPVRHYIKEKLTCRGKLLFFV